MQSFVKSTNAGNRPLYILENDGMGVVFREKGKIINKNISKRLSRKLKKEERVKVTKKTKF